MPTLRVTGCRIDTRSITVSFSEQVDQSTALGTGSTNAKEPTNYTIFAPNSGLNPAQSPSGWQISVETDGRTVAMSAPSTVSFNPGDWVLLTVKNIGLASATGVAAMANQEPISRQVSGSGDTRRATRDFEDAISYPILTEEVAYRPSPVGIPTTGAGGISGPGGSNLGQVAMQAVSDVLGWKANSSDPKGFIGALTQSFTLTDVEGHIESTWKPRSYAVQTDLGGGITGAQASLYMRAKDALDQSLNLLDGLYPLDPEADPEYVKSLREMARSQMTEIVKEFGVVGLPSILRINTYFGILLGKNPANLTAGEVDLDPDGIGGTLGELRDTYGIYFKGNQFNNSVQDEQDITNFRVISDYMTSLEQSWIANREFFVLRPRVQAFFGTQLVLISRQFNVIAETVNELRFALDSVFIGPNERQTLLLEFDDHSLPPMFLEDVLDEVGSFVAEEGPRLLRDGGKISVTNNILPVVDTLRRMIEQAHHPKDQKRRVPDGFKTARVRHALDDLQKQLTDLVDLAKQVELQLPPPEGKPVISSVTASQSGNFPDDVTLTLTILGEQFDSAATVEVFSAIVPDIATSLTVQNSETIIFTLTLTEPTDLSAGSHDVVVTNPAGPSARYENAFSWDQGSGTVSPPSLTSASARRSISSRPAGTTIRRQTAITVNQQPVPPTPTPASSRTAVPTPATPAPPAGVTQQLTALQGNHAILQQGLADLQANHTALAQKIDDVQRSTQATLDQKFAEVQQSHTSLLDEVKGLGEKIASFFESKDKKSKKDD